MSRAYQALEVTPVVGGRRATTHVVGCLDSLADLRPRRLQLAGAVLDDGPGVLVAVRVAGADVLEPERAERSEQLLGCLAGFQSRSRYVRIDQVSSWKDIQVRVAHGE